MYQPDTSAIGGSIALTALVSTLPLLVVFVLLGFVKAKAHVAGLAGLATAVLVAVVGFGMPTSLALAAATQGAVYGLVPIMWIVVAAIWLYGLTVVSGRFDDLRDSFNRVSDDPRVQGIIIAFCFGGLLEALAGFGAPVAITGIMLVSLGFPAMRAAATVLLANTAPVAFGSIAIPIITAGNLTGIDYHDIGAVVGRQAPFLALVVPMVLVFVIDGWQGVRDCWPVALVGGGSFAVAQFVSSNFISVELTDIIASLVALVAVVALGQVWQPPGGAAARDRLRMLAESDAAGLAEGLRSDGSDTESPSGTGGSAGARPGAGGGTATITRARHERLTASGIFMAFLPYLIVIVVFSASKLWTPLKTFLLGTDVKIAWPLSSGQILTTSGKPSATTTYTLPWLSGAGTLLLLCGIVVMLLYRVPVGVAVKEFGSTLTKLRWAILTVASVLSLAYVMNLSGQTISIGTWLAAGTGAFFAFLSPVLGWVGTAVTGSDTSANALFATLQQSAGTKAGIDPTLLVAANTTGGVVGKMISPQNLTIAATAVGLLGRESEIFRRMIRWSLALLLALCVLVYLQSTAMSWMLW